MKKYISMMVVCLAILSSCTNEDISVGNLVTVKVNPSGVIAPFEYEMNPGDFEGIGAPYKLRTSVFVYDKDGLLKASETQYLANYSTIMTTSLELPKGNYTAIAITDVVKMSGEDITFEYWNVSGEDVISQLKVTDAGYIGSEKKILGVGKQTISVGDKNGEFMVKCSAAGAVCLVYYCNIHAFSDVKQYGVLMTKSSDNISFNESGNYDVSIESSGTNFSWWLSKLAPGDYSSYKNIYSYLFVLPMNKVTLQFIADTDDNRYYLDEKVTMNLEAGKEYLMMLDLDDEDYGITSLFMQLSDDYYAPQMRSLEQNVGKIDTQMCNQSVYVKDLF